MTGWKIGSVTVTPVIELTLPIPATFLLPEATPQALEPYAAWLRPGYLTETGLINLVIQAFLVESRGRKIIVDTCVGNGKTRAVPQMSGLDTPFLERITDAGFPPEQVDTVICTHLHVDHVGWNTKQVDGRWVPTFPNARYLFTREEWEYWRGAEGVSAMARTGDYMADSVVPIVEAGLADFVPMNHQLFPEVSLIPAAGHTPGLVCVDVRSSRERLVLAGDLLHSPLQCVFPEWKMLYCVDAAASARTRVRLLSEWAESRTPILPTHFPSPSAGLVERSNDAFRFRYL
jgi:glyoxylase-like metal-dependent hydrolase (beta-lactamase superfamily II)